MFRRLLITGSTITSLILVLTSIALSNPFLPPLPHRIGGTVTVDGMQITQANDTGYTFKITRQDGTDYLDFNNNPAQDTDGVNDLHWYLIDIPIYDASTQPQGAIPGETALIHIYKDSTELKLTSPINGELTVGESDSNTQTDLVTGSSPPSIPPIADAGSNQTVCKGAVIILDGTGSTDTDGSIVSYQWNQSNGPEITLSDSATALASFTVPNTNDTEALLSFNLTVTDNDGLTGTDTCFVSIVKPELSVTPTFQDVSETGGTATFEIVNKSTCTMNWKAEADESSPWISIQDPDSGTDNSAVTISCEANPGDPRTGAITITAPGAANSPQTVELNQTCKPAALSVEPSYYDIPGTKGIVELTVANTGGCSMNWTASENTDWFSTDHDSGTNNGSITINYAANPGNPRTGAILITAPGTAGTPKSVEIRQACIPAVLSVSPVSSDVPETDGEITVSVANNGGCAMNWTALTNDSWLTVANGDSGTNIGKITVKYNANPGHKRTGAVTIAAPDAADSSQIIEIRQACIPANLSVSQSSPDIPGTEGTATFSIANTGGCTMSWAASSDTDWLSVTPDSGTDSRKITVNYEANPGDPRTGQIRITTPDPGITPQTIEIRQACIPAVLSVTPSSVYLPETGGETTFSIRNKGGCPMTWKASENADWFSIFPDQGINSESVTIVCESNAGQQKTGAITITTRNAENSPMTLRVRQAPTTQPLNWIKMESTVSENLNSIWGSSENNVFAVGHRGTILHYDGNDRWEWEKIPANTVYDLKSIWGSSENNVFAVGEQGIILRYDGNENRTWTEMESRTSENLRGVWGSSGNNVFAAGEQGAVLRYDGNEDGIWTTMPVPDIVPIYSIWVSSENNVFTAGGTWNSSSVFLCDGKDADWTETPVPNIPRGIWGNSQTDIFAVGDSGMILRYDGTRWRETESGTSKYLTNVWGSAANNVFAVGADGIILHYDGRNWEKMRSDTLRDLYGIWGSSEDDVFTVGRRGIILRYSPGILARQRQEQSAAKQTALNSLP